MSAPTEEQVIEKFDELLKENLTDNGYKLFQSMDEKMPKTYHRLSSSSKKYHQKEDGRVPSIREHTYEMLFIATKLLSVFDVEPKTSDADVFILSIALHDRLKYGTKPNTAKHTNRKHDQIMADVLEKNRNILESRYDSEAVDIMVECVRFHSGRWSTDEGWNKISSRLSFLVHIIDILSTNDLIKCNL